MMFVRDSKVVFDEVWSWELHPYIYPKGAVYFKVKDLIVKKKEAKFRASKNKDGDLILEKIEQLLNLIRYNGLYTAVPVENGI